MFEVYRFFNSTNIKHFINFLRIFVPMLTYKTDPTSEMFLMLSLSKAMEHLIACTHFHGCMNLLDEYHQSSYFCNYPCSCLYAALYFLNCLWLHGGYSPLPGKQKFKNKKYPNGESNSQNSFIKVAKIALIHGATALLMKTAGSCLKDQRMKWVLVGQEAHLFILK